jgi:hypothetical protein
MLARTTMEYAAMCAEMLATGNGQLLGFTKIGQLPVIRYT